MKSIDKTFQISINNKNHLITIRKKDIKRIIIRVDQRNNIFVNCPNRCSYDDALKYLQAHTDWLEKVIVKQEESLKFMAIDDCINFKKVWYLGNLFELEEDYKMEGQYKIVDDIIFFKGNVEKVLETIRKDLYFKINEEFNLVYKSFNDHIKQKPFLEIKKMKSRWGSCNYKTGKIVINKMLVHVPNELLHYVMVHEFSHFLYPNHSKNFHDFLKQCLPDYKIKEKILKKFAFLLQIY